MNKIDILFSLYKDTGATYFSKDRKVLQKKYPDVDISGLHRMIVNYQIQKYGEPISNCSFEILDSKECRRRSHIVDKCRAMRRKFRKIDKSDKMFEKRYHNERRRIEKG